MRKLYAGMAGLLLAGIPVQFFLAAAGAFDPAPRQESFQMHTMLGRLLFLLALLTIGAAALARAPGRLVGRTAATAGLIVVQSLIALVARGFEGDGGGGMASTLVFGLHAVNALAIMAVARTVLVGARAHARAPLATPGPGAASGTPTAAPSAAAGA